VAPGGTPDGASPVRSINAVTLATADMAAALAFYTALGFPLVFGGPDDAFASLRAGDGYLNLQLDPASAPTGVWGRVILWVDDVDAMHARVTAAGFAPIGRPTDAPWGERYFHVRDPDGHELSFARPI
jgi:catechol 2,3-dioxygenase-like lactoylglutathione lyase family enzyme